MERETSEMETHTTQSTLEETSEQTILETVDNITTNTNWLGEDIRDPHDSFRGAREDF